ncbi:hypothetical protein HOP54_06200 [Halomonas daqingensis]|uniref:hypothetical protein n=1 Tax=Billgrantia desiderata TaxID=52021 RepID=UPI001F308444|nr:hypothetical protein [Halomonas desiderata]MCE8014361.1 hypothetical protein [Halomonas desiderata]MCE8028278.1 hypothetical protein [Halomonas desiderata]
MSEIILQITTFSIHHGQLERFKESIEKAVEFARRNGPQLLVEVYIDEDRMRAKSIQIQRDSEAILAHWKISDPYIQDVMKSCTLLHIDMYGDPNQEVLDGMKPLLRDGVTMNVMSGFVGFGRFSI